MAAWKIEGFVVTPTTCWVAMSSARLPDSMRVRDRSSSQMETPSSDSDLRGATALLMFCFIFFRAYGVVFLSV